MIESFADKDTESLFFDGTPRKFGANVRKWMVQKLQLLDVAETLDDLRNPSGNRLESLSGNRAGCHSIRINDQWRVCFRWHNGNATDVEIIDYH